MGYNCAICGGPLSQPRWGYNEDGSPWYDYAQDDWSGYDDPTRDYAPDVLSSSDPELHWLSRIVVIHNGPRIRNASTPDFADGPTSPDLPASPGPLAQSPASPTWPSSSSSSAPLNDANHDVGDGGDNVPNFSDSESGGPVFETYSPGIDLYYFDYGAGSLHIPMHRCCVDLFARYLDTSVSEMNNASFFEALKSFSTELETHLDIDYKDIEPAMSTEVWNRQRGQEYFLFNPFRVKDLDKFYQNLPQPDTSVYKETKIFSVNGDVFRKLSTDVILLIMSQLDVANVYKMRQISPAFSSIDLGAGFWKYHILADMPWLWDCPISGNAGVDWERVYRKLYWGSRYQAEGNRKIHGLCNRRRIWEQMCPTFASVYEENEHRRIATGFVIPPTLLDGARTTMTQLVKPEPRFSHDLTESLVDQYADLADANVSIRFDWSEQGHLIAVHILKGGQLDPFKRKMKLLDLAKMDTIRIPNDDWPTGFIFSSRVTNPEEVFEKQERQVVGVSVLLGKAGPIELGDCQRNKCLLQVFPGYFATGLRMRCFPDGKLFKLSIIQQNSVEMLQDSSRINNLSRGRYYTGMINILWRDSLPPPDSHLSAFYTAERSFSSSIVREVEPADLLTFATSEEEMADITGISIAEEIGGIEVTYGHRESRSIGPRFQNMTTLPIDGQGGERIVKFSVIPEALDELQVMTNRGRTLRVSKAPSLEAFGSPNFHEAPFSNARIYSSSGLYFPNGILALWIGGNLKGFAVLGSSQTGLIPPQ